jgi:hypothetical protein
MSTAPKYAEGTDVPVERSRAEIETILRKHGASGLATGWDYDERKGYVACRMKERNLHFQVVIPPASEFEFTAGKVKRNKAQLESAIAAEERRRWRGLLLVIKAKLELVASGGTSFDREFLADIMLPDGSTIGDSVVPRIGEAYANGKMPKLGLLLGSGS